ncbi:hypothetical protein GCM10025768_02540 [Microbacterium pseudoresistens]|uniref:Plasmid stability protein n=1 Tax=Microbacterium pseudoresistens TaxID=640634 RepID=A0A7Y9EUA4_9MICO|nr:hypothetical protein [Microbacterium pseudoresistens]NYD54089.1 plasmid stability protein [Microbacterium pseudoresistens]
MAAITIRNIPDEVVDALKARAKRNARSMEAEVREILSRTASGDESGLEASARERLGVRAWTIRGDEINAWIDAHPPTEEQLRAAREWAAELEADRENPILDDSLIDPWERAEQLARERAADRL